MIYLSNCFVAWTQFKRQALCYCFGLVCATPVFVAAYIADDFAVMMSGMTMWWLASLVALSFVWFWKVLPEALHPERKYDQAQGTETETNLLLEKERQLVQIQEEIKAIQVFRDKRYLMLSETMGWNASTNTAKLRRRQTDTDLPSDYDNNQDANQFAGGPRRTTTPLQNLV